MSSVHQTAMSSTGGIIAVALATSVLSQSLCNPNCYAEDTKTGVSPRIVEMKPALGRSVETEQGFMVPYRSRIPGTDITFDMVPVPGSDTNGKRSNWIQPFWIGKYEVSLAEYREYMRVYDTFRYLDRDKKRRVNDENRIDAVSAPTALYDPDWRFGYAEAEEFESGKKAPATSMSLFAARQYTKWLSLIGDIQYRLPTEIEWEHACRAGTKTNWSFGDDESLAPQYAHFDHDLPETPLPLGSLKPNAWDIHDMHGNVSEWVVQRKFLNDGVATLLQKRWRPDHWTRARNTAFKQWIMKGGDWTKPIQQCRVSIREIATESLWENDPQVPESPTWMSNSVPTRIGFRIVSSLQPLPRREIEMYWGPDTEYLADAENMNIEGGRGVRGLVDKQLPAIVRQYEQKNRRPAN